jgi:FADH2 O2-dependent halogenase
MKYDVAIVGGGFSGSLLAAILARAGRGVVLIDPAAGPRFAIGESSTPMADLLIERIAERWQLPELAPLARYGRWKAELPDLVCGCKRGFSYFRHRAGTPFRDDAEHSQSLLVTASRSRPLADTHWLRSDVDHWLRQLAIGCGTEHRVGRVKRLALQPTATQLDVEDGAGSVSSLRAAMVLICGPVEPPAGSAGWGDETHRLRTHSYARYGHYAGVGSWDALLAADRQPRGDFPFDADDAAQHHWLDAGWLWMLRFDNGVTSVGRVTSTPLATVGEARAPGSGLGLECYPSLRRLFERATFVAPAGGPVRSGRLQKLVRSMVGDRWAMIPTAAATIDPLHSSGIAHALSGVWRLAEILLEPAAESRRRRLEAYAATVQREALQMDRLVAGCYAAGSEFALFKAHAMCYFVAAIASEETLAATGSCPPLWLAHDASFDEVVEQSYRRIASLDKSDRAAVAAHLCWTRQALEPWNRAGLMDPAVRNMYRYTAAPKASVQAVD